MLAAAFAACGAFAAPSARRVTATSFGPDRTTPVQHGEFSVALVVITFPDCVKPKSTEEVRSGLTYLKGGTIDSYYKEYSQGITWPVLEAYPATYMVPHPLGYYCRWNHFTNPLGFKDDGPVE